MSSYRDCVGSGGSSRNAWTPLAMYAHIPSKIITTQAPMAILRQPNRFSQPISVKDNHAPNAMPKPSNMPVQITSIFLNF